MLLHLKSLAYIEMLLILGILLFRTALRPTNRSIIGSKAVTLTLLTPVVALTCGNALIFYLYLMSAVAFTSRSRSELCATYLMMLPLTPALGQEIGAGGAYLLPLSTIFAMNFGALLGFSFLQRERVAWRGILDFGAVMFVVLFVYIDGRDLGLTSFLRSSIVFVVQLGAPYIVMSRGVARREDVNRVLLRLAYAGTLCAIVALFQTTRHWVLYQSFNDALNIREALGSSTLYVRGGHLRTGGTLVDYSAAGVFLACVLVVIPGLWQQFRRAWGCVVIVALLGGLFATQSRGAWVAAGGGIAIICIYRGYITRGIGLLAVASIGQLALPEILAPTSNLAETMGAGGGSIGSTEYRKNLLDSGLRQIMAHPLLGQPPRQLASSMPEMIQGQHFVDFVNTHLYVAMAAGVPWFVVWFLIWMTPILLVWRNRPRGQARQSVDLAEMPMAMIMTAMLALTFTSTIDRNLCWPAIALGLISPCIVLRNATRGSLWQSSVAPVARLSTQANASSMPPSLQA